MRPSILENIQNFEIADLLEWLRFCTKPRTGNYSEEVVPNSAVSIFNSLQLGA
jgi:hypothetical protein